MTSTTAPLGSSPRPPRAPPTAAPAARRTSTSASPSATSYLRPIRVCNCACARQYANANPYSASTPASESSRPPRSSACSPAGGPPRASSRVFTARTASNGSHPMVTVSPCARSEGGGVHAPLNHASTRAHAPNNATSYHRHHHHHHQPRRRQYRYAFSHRRVHTVSRCTSTRIECSFGRARAAAPASDARFARAIARSRRVMCAAATPSARPSDSTSQGSLPAADPGHPVEHTDRSGCMRLGSCLVFATSLHSLIWNISNSNRTNRIRFRREVPMAC